MKFEILESDIEFTDSPDSQTPECICSRCKKVMMASPVFRAWTENNTEYRYCTGLRVNDKCDDELNYKQEQEELDMFYDSL